nr:restriction endonuclease subunit S [uncultured Flavobacterium sp.]
MATENLIPQIRFPEFSGNWKPKLLGKIAKFSKGKGISKADIKEDGEIECIRYGELYTEYSETISEVKSRTDVDPNELVFSEANDVIIPSSGETQIDIATASCVLRDGIALGGDLNIIKSDVDGVFLSYYLNYRKKNAIAQLAQGISVVHLYSSQLKNLTLILPKPNEQTKIANFIAKIDTQIQLLEKEKALLEKYKKAISKKIFNQEIRFKDDNGNDFPDWEEKSIDEIATLHRGSSLSKSDLDKNGINYCVHYGELFTKYNEVIFEVVSKTNIENGILSKIGDILMPSSDVTPEGLAKASAIIIDNVTLGGDINIIRPINVNSIFLSYVLNSNKKSIMKIVSGTTVKHIYNKDLKTLVFSYPVTKEQEKIGLFLLEIDRVINNKLSEIGIIKQFKKSLLQKMFV